jgi:PAT family beta-lactamase induction signal transducer AmpG
VKRPPPWLFVLTGMPYGVVGSFASTVMPYLTSKADVEIGAIGWYGAMLQLPTVLLFLYAPLVDLGPRYKVWLVIVSVLGAVCLVASCLMPLPDHTTAFLAFAVAAQTISGLVGSCNGALMAATMTDAQRGKASGWYQVGNQSGGGLSAAIVIWMAGHEVAPGRIGATLAVMMIVPALAALWIAEPVRTLEPAGVVFRRTLSDVKTILSSKLGLTGLALCISPVGTSALSYYFAGMFKPYGVSSGTVALVNGLGSVAMTAIGAFVGGYLCDRYNRRVLYLVGGALTAMCGIAMALSPRTELTFIVGVAVYMLLTGFGYAAFTAVVLETIGQGGSAAATKFSMYFAGGNAAILYVGLIDTRFEARHGVEGVIGSDAALNIAGVIVLGLAFWRLGSFGKWRHPVVPLDEAR